MNPIKKTIYGLIKKLKFLPPPFYMKIYHEYYTGKKLDLDNPKEFNEKIQWIKVFYKPNILSKLVDKYEVRDYVKDVIGDKYLNSILGVYSSVEEVNFDELPNRFVLKGTHGSNYNYIVTNKDKDTIRTSKKKMKKWLGRNYYYRSGLEWAYKNVPPRVIAETFMEEEGKEVLNDYKFYCFNGEPKFVQIDIDRNINNYRCFYDIAWKKLPFTKGKNQLFPDDSPKPENLEEMIELSKKLSKPFPFVRVDFFSVNGKTIFGEMTFYPGDGRTEFNPEKYNRIFGDHLTLPKIPKGKKFIDSV